MSLVQFDEIYEICCEMAELPVEVKKVIPPAVDNYRWWEKAVREVLEENAKQAVIS